MNAAAPRPFHKAGHNLADKYRSTRALTEALAAPLSESDATIQSMEDASPAKWHLAHVTWFWETFLLRDHLDGYTLYDERWPFVFNSYYEAEGERIDRFSRGLMSRPTVQQILDWRAHVDEAIMPLLEREELAPLIMLGFAHEQQHQELLLTDIKHALSRNPLGPAMWNGMPAQSDLRERNWIEHPGGIALVGHDGEGFAFDCEGPRHRTLLEPFALADTLVTNGEWDEFIADGGYDTAALWLSDGWSWVQENRIASPGYWREDEYFTLQGWQSRDAAASGNQLDDAGPVGPTGTKALFGDCWQFTRSAYLPYPRFKEAPGAVGEYNGKFMSGQFVLKGASCATVRGHSRASYRNFFYPHQRWQFTGLRLAKDI